LNPVSKRGLREVMASSLEKKKSDENERGENEDKDT
jgi:hypothetical protein